MNEETYAMMQRIIELLEKDIPEDVKEGLDEMGQIRFYIRSRTITPMTINLQTVRRYNSLCWKYFGRIQDIPPEPAEEEAPAKPEPEKALLDIPPIRGSIGDERALEIVYNYAKETFGLSLDFDVYIVWKCKTLQNWKYLISSTLPDGMYYELTYNGDKREWYLDAYAKSENRVIQEGGS